MSRIVKNLINGKYIDVNNYLKIKNKINNKILFKVADTKIFELEELKKSINNVPKSGLHNPFKNPERYRILGDVCFKTAHNFKNKFIKSTLMEEIVQTTGKTYEEAEKEINVSRKFLENFSGDQVRFLAKGFNTPGDHFGQICNSYRFPYGSVSVISPFNFPLEIPLLQVMGALFMGNKPILKVDSKVSIVMDTVLKIMHKNGLPKNDIDFIHCNGYIMENLLLDSNVNMTQFTGSSKIANRLSKKLYGKIKIEGGGFDWKIIGPLNATMDRKNIYKIASDDAYTFSGQKCSAQSILFIHKSWDLNQFI